MSAEPVFGNDVKITVVVEAHFKVPPTAEQVELVREGFKALFTGTSPEGYFIVKSVVVQSLESPP